jgi:UDP-N-acetyl-2-amino-2-deoxyglucuronate dehydrogenase
VTVGTRVGLIGLGDAGRHHVRALVALEAQGLLLFSAVCAPDHTRLEKACVDLGISPQVPRFSALSEVLASDTCDALILATPDGLHAEQIIACAQQHVHVLVEKPLALTRAEGEQAVAAARAGGIVLQVGYQLRQHCGHQLVHAQRETLIGPLRHLSIHWAWPDPAKDGWRARGQAARFHSLAALGTHAIDLVLWFVDAAIDGVTALTVPAQGRDRAAEVALRFENGILAQLSVSVTHRAKSRFLLVGQSGELECLSTLGARGEGEVWLRPLHEPAQLLPFGPQNPYRNQLQVFIDRVQSSVYNIDDIEASLINLSVLDRISAL